MTVRSFLAVALTALTIGATTSCATSGAAGGGSSQNVLTRADLSGANVQTVYEAIDLLRPRWLSSRGLEPDVYMDGMRAGDLNYLRQLRVNEVSELRFFPAGEQGPRFGGNPSGVIEVIRPSP